MADTTHKAKPRRRAAADMREIARWHSTKALQKLVGLIDSKNERVALSACQTVLDRGHGKVAQAMNLKAPEGGLTVNIVRFTQGEEDAS